MVAAFHPEVSIAARASRSRDAGRVIRCLDVEPMMNLTEPVAATERVMNEVRQDYRICKLNKMQSCQSCKIV